MISWNKWNYRLATWYFCLVILRIGKKFLSFFQGQQNAGAFVIGAAVLGLFFANMFPSASWVRIASDAHHPAMRFINDGLMTLFFLLIGLEIKREFTLGELNRWEFAALPVFGAIGGMVIPALFYLSFLQGSAQSHGWGIPMATDIAFAAAIGGLLGKKFHPTARIILMSLAVVDDLGAVLVIALQAPSLPEIIPLMSAIGLAIVIYLIMQKMPWHPLLSLIALLALWILLEDAGIHPTLAGILLALGTPVHHASFAKLQHWMEIPVNKIIMPVFAFLNMSIVLDSTAGDWMPALSTGIILGLWIGKPLGIITWMAMAKKIFKLTLPKTLGQKQWIILGFLGGIGFTMSLFMSLQAFPLSHSPEIYTAKVSVLIGSILSMLCAVLLSFLPEKGNR